MTSIHVTDNVVTVNEFDPDLLMNLNSFPHTPAQEAMIPCWMCALHTGLCMGLPKSPAFHLSCYTSAALACDSSHIELSFLFLPPLLR